MNKILPLFMLVFLWVGALSAQNVGINTATPNETLEVDGTARVTSLAGTGKRYVLADGNGTLEATAIPAELRIYNTGNGGPCNYPDNLTTTNTGWTTYDFDYSTACADANFHIIGDIPLVAGGGGINAFQLSRGAYRVHVRFADGGLNPPHGTVEYRLVVNGNAVATSTQATMTWGRTWCLIEPTLFEVGGAGGNLEVQMRSVDGNPVSLDYVMFFLEKLN